MLPGITPALQGGGAKLLFPAQANGNDSYTVSLLHFDCPDANIGTAYFPDSAYGAPSRKNAWYTYAGTPNVNVSEPFGQQCGFFTGGSSIACPHAPDLIPSGDFTIDFWAAFPALTASYDLIGKRDTAIDAPYLFYMSVTTLYLFASSTGGWDITGCSP